MPELLRIQAALQSFLETVGALISLRYVALDGHFGNYPSAFMVRQENLHLISKLRSDAALYPAFEGEHNGPGPKPKYGAKMDVHKLDPKYLKETSTEDNLRTDIYQGQFCNKEFAFALNVVIILKTNLDDTSPGARDFVQHRLGAGLRQDHQVLQLALPNRVQFPRRQTILGLGRFHECQRNRRHQCCQPVVFHGQFQSCVIATFSANTIRSTAFWI